jgi:hypothetical protein
MPDNRECSLIRHKSQTQAASSREDKSVTAADMGLVSKFSGIWAVRGGIGRSSKAVYHHLSEDQPRTVTLLAKLSGRAKSTVSKSLSELQTIGLATQTDKGFILGDVSLKEACQVLGAEDLTSKRKTWHKWEQEAHRKYRKLVEVEV